MLAGVAPILVGQPSAGLAPVLALGLFALLAYSALLGRAVVFLVLLLPIGHLLKSAGLVARSPGLAPCSARALLTLPVVATAPAGAIVCDGLPDDGLGLIFLLLGLVGVRSDPVAVASAVGCWPRGSPNSCCFGTVIGLFVAGRRTAP